MNALERLDSFIEERKQEYVSSLQLWYRDSKYYREPTLNNLFGDYIGPDIARFKENLEDSKDVSEFVECFDVQAREYGRSWYDEDLNCVRSGYEDETKWCFTLRNIAAQAAGVPEAKWEGYYEGYGTA